ncbi:MarR family winged helix-turn-helix transcriptional regulator [Anaerorhabdus sp.]|uniref:MarR family winged helix-turn-helix transcriptional regulator n=1 Tax=Anaerorhabdus sp. TaxID=1872524 RepID=UPI002FC81655
MDKKELKKELINYIDINLEKVSKSFAREFKVKYSLSPNQMSSLWYLRKFGRMTMGEFASKMHMSKQQATKHVQLLVERNLLKREYEESNRRTIYIVLAEDGLIATRGAEDIYVERFVNEMSKLSVNDQENLIRAILDINHILPKMKMRAE